MNTVFYCIFVLNYIKTTQQLLILGGDLPEVNGWFMLLTLKLSIWHRCQEPFAAFTFLIAPLFQCKVKDGNDLLKDMIKFSAFRC